MQLAPHVRMGRGPSRTPFQRGPGVFLGHPQVLGRSVVCLFCEDGFVNIAITLNFNQRFLVRVSYGKLLL